MVLPMEAGCSTGSIGALVKPEGSMTCVRCHGTGWQRKRADCGIGIIGGTRIYALKSGPCRWCRGCGYIFMGSLLGGIKK